MTSQPSQLLRALGPWIATAVVVGTVIGSGVFLKPKVIAGAVPDFAYVALIWSSAGLLTLLGALALAEVAVLFPQAGGNYVYLREAFGKLAGFLWGWVDFWIIRAGSIAALSTIFVESLNSILGRVLDRSLENPVLSFWDQRLVTVGTIAILSWVNIRGVRWGGGLQLFITLVKVASLLAILLLPFLLGFRIHGDFNASLFDQPATVEFSWGKLGTAFLATLWSYHGWMNLAPIAGEVKEPNRNLPLAFLGGTLIIIFLYVGANLAYALVLPQAEMARLPQDQHVAAVFSQRLLGPIGGLLTSAAIMISVFGALNGNLLVGPRLLYAMGRDGLAPSVLGEVHASYRTPAPATVAVAGWSMGLILFSGMVVSWTGMKKPLFDLLTDYAMFGAVIFETLAVATIFVFRRSLASVHRPYQCPGYPWVPIAYLILPVFVLYTMFSEQTLEAVAGLGFIGLGAVVYFVLFKQASIPAQG